MRFILLQNLVTTSSSRSKGQYAQQVFDCLKNSFPTTTAQLAAISTRPFQWKQPSPIAVAPSVETLLCAEFPFLFKTCLGLSLSFPIDSTRPRSLFEWQGCVPSHNSPIDTSEGWFTEFPQLKKTLDAPRLSRGRRNYWSKFNSSLMTFQPGQPIAIHLPVAVFVSPHLQSLHQQDALLCSLCSIHAIHTTTPLLTSQAVHSTTEWQEMVVKVCLLLSFHVVILSSPLAAVSHHVAHP